MNYYPSAQANGKPISRHWEKSWSLWRSGEAALLAVNRPGFVVKSDKFAERGARLITDARFSVGSPAPLHRHGPDPGPPTRIRHTGLRGKVRYTPIYLRRMLICNDRSGPTRPSTDPRRLLPTHFSAESTRFLLSTVLDFFVHLPARLGDLAEDKGRVEHWI